MRPCYIAFIAITCLCCGCEKKKDTPPSTVTTTTITTPVDTTKVVSIYPYTDTFYGVWNDIGSDNVYFVYPDTSFATIFYVTHIDSVSIDISGAVTQYKAGCFISSYGIPEPTCYFVPYNFPGLTDPYNGTATDSYTFKGDSLYASDVFGNSSIGNYGTFAGKGNVHKH